MADFSTCFSGTQYDPKDAYWMAEFALSAYDDAATSEAKTKDLGLSDFKFFDNLGTQAFCASDSEKIFLSFRGTEATKIQDIAADLKFRKHAGVFGNVHRGFKGALDAVWDDVFSFVSELGNKRLYITGHSLGAALASLAAANFNYKDTVVSGIYTFGQPRVGDKGFAKTYDSKLGSRHFRFVNNNDVVTRVPNVGYHHIGQFLYITTKGEIVHDIGLLKLEADRVAGRIEDIGKPGTDGVKDHSMVKYLANVKENINVNPFN